MTLSSPAEPGSRAIRAPARPCPACLAPVLEEEHRSLSRCPACGTLSAPPPSEAELAAYYNGAYQVEAHDLTPARRERWTPLVDAVERAISGRTGLDFGSSGGAFLRLATARGWQMAGIEVDERARTVHRRLAPEIPVWSSLAEARAGGLSGLDAAWMLHTVEHLPMPEARLGEVAAALRPRGVLMLTTPNGSSLQSRVLRGLWEWWTPPAHLALLTPRGAIRLMDRAGFDVLQLSTRRGDSMGFASNLLLAPARAIKRRRDGGLRQSVSVHAATCRLAKAVNFICDPLTAMPRRLAYGGGLLGPELVILARRKE